MKFVDDDKLTGDRPRVPRVGKYCDIFNRKYLIFSIFSIFFPYIYQVFAYTLLKLYEIYYQIIVCVSGLAWYISPIYIIDIYPIYIRYFRSKIANIFYIFNFYRVFKYFLMRHIVTMFWFSVCVFCWLITCAFSIFSVLDNFCQISPLHSNEA